MLGPCIRFARSLNKGIKHMRHDALVDESRKQSYSSVVYIGGICTERPVSLPSTLPVPPKDDRNC